MELVYKGKTKDVYLRPDGNYLLKFKDDATGKDGKFDPGENSVGLRIDGLGKKSLALSQHFFKKLFSLGVPTHYLDSDLEAATMIVKPAMIFGKGIEVICRFKAVGSFCKRYGDYVTEGQDLPAFVEFTLKNDERQDPPITKEALVFFNIMTEDEYDTCVDLARSIAGYMRMYLAGKGLTLYDIKYEFGKIDGEISLIDEISGGNMRVYNHGEWVQPMDLTGLIVGK